MVDNDNDNINDVVINCGPEHYGDVGRGNRVFILMYPENDKIDILHFELHKMSNDSMIDIGTFLTY